MSPLVRKKIVRPQTVALVDIGSGSVGAALVEIAHAHKPHIVAHIRTPLRLLPGRSAANLEPHVISALAAVLRSLPASRRTVQHVAVFLPAPWSALSLHKVRFAEDRAFLANTALMNRLVREHVQHEQEVALASAQNKHAADTVFERAVAGLRLNGYVSPAMPENSKVFRIEMMLASARASEAFVGEVRRLVHERFADTPVTLHSSSLAAAHALAVTMPERPTFLLCDGEGELAELLMVRDTIPEAHATIPVGYATILRTLSTHSGVTHEELPSLVALLSDQHSPVQATAQEAVELAQKECGEALGASEELCRIYAPRTCYLIGDGPEAAWFADAITRSPRLRSILPPDFETRVLSARILSREVSWEHAKPRFKGDAMLALESLYASDRFGSSETQRFYV